MDDLTTQVQRLSCSPASPPLLQSLVASATAAAQSVVSAHDKDSARVAREALGRAVAVACRSESVADLVALHSSFDVMESAFSSTTPSFSASSALKSSATRSITCLRAIAAVSSDPVATILSIAEQLLELNVAVLEKPTPRAARRLAYASISVHLAQTLVALSELCATPATIAFEVPDAAPTCVMTGNQVIRTAIVALTLQDYAEDSKGVLSPADPMIQSALLSVRSIPMPPTVWTWLQRQVETSALSEDEVKFYKRVVAAGPRGAVEVCCSLADGSKVPHMQTLMGLMQASFVEPDAPDDAAVEAEGGSDDEDEDEDDDAGVLGVGKGAAGAGAGAGTGGAPLFMIDKAGGNAALSSEGEDGVDGGDAEEDAEPTPPPRKRAARKSARRTAAPASTPAPTPTTTTRRTRTRAASRS